MLFSAFPCPIPLCPIPARLQGLFMKPQPDLTLRGFEFQELFTPQGLAKLDRAFRRRLSQVDEQAAEGLDGLRARRWSQGQEISEILLKLAPHVETFLAHLFGIEQACGDQTEETRDQMTLFRFREAFVAKRGRRWRKPLRPVEELNARLAEPLSAADPERAVARYGLALLADEPAHAADIEILTQWCAVGLADPAATGVAGWTTFKLPRRTDFARLVDMQPVGGDKVGRMQADPARHRRRDGFALTDPRMSRRQALGEVDYCIYCHDHDGDFCSRGFPEKKGLPEQGLKINPLGETLTGCPLGERVSEMQVLKKAGGGIAALAMAMADNPMVPATGHRICNDCMKACVYQKQDPVDIPQVETRILTDVLDLPWGVEIYDLLTRWNPLREKQWVMQPYNGRKVLVAGMGPAGFTMAHHLTMEGCAVVGIDGLKIEPLPEELARGPVYRIDDLREALDERILAGFGGVAEYGITVRWDKNFLRLIYLSLSRRPGFQVFGGVRLGGAVTLEDAWTLGFDHVCIATGAGEPKVIPVGNALARGMRQANDFLMALQLTGAAKRSSLANLQVRLPAVVIGGGLTAVDTATEVQAYYIVQVEKTLERYETLGEQAVADGLDPESREVLQEFLAHGRVVREERTRAEAAGEPPDFIRLIRAWGGVTIAYRRSLNESPAYLRNHEEIIQAMDEGIYFAEALDPRRAILDEHGHVKAMEFRRRHRSKDGRWLEDYSKVQLPARAVLVAAGASPNTIYEKEYPGTFRQDGNHFRPHIRQRDRLQPVQVAPHVKAAEFGPFTSYDREGRNVTFLGDTHPVFHGSVVKAIASAQRSYPSVMKTMAQSRAADPDALAYQAFRAEMQHRLQARVVSVDASHPAVVEVWVRAPMAARNFRSGQFFRLQTYECSSPLVEDTRLQIPLATVSGAGVDGDKVRLMILRWGANPEIAARLRPGDPVVLMGPTGAPAPIPRNKTILVIAGAWGGAVLLDLGRAWRAQGNRVLLFAAYPARAALFGKRELEQCADQIVWCAAGGEPIPAERPQDRSVTGGDMIRILKDYAENKIEQGENGIDLKQVDELAVMGSTGLLKAMQQALKTELAEVFKPDIEATGAVGSPMQCMMKGVCAQCLQWQIDPETGERTRAVFSCAQQDQPLHWIDVDHLAARQGQARLMERVNGAWAGRLLKDMG